MYAMSDTRNWSCRQGISKSKCFSIGKKYEVSMAIQTRDTDDFQFKAFYTAKALTSKLKVNKLKNREKYSRVEKTTQKEAKVCNESKLKKSRLSCN